MKGLLLVLFLFAVGIAGVGYYQGWFSVSSDKSDPKSNVTFTYDGEKVKEDTDKAKEKLHSKEKSTDKAKEPQRQP